MKFDSDKAAEMAGLVISDRGQPGITRTRVEKAGDDDWFWEYRDSRGGKVDSACTAFFNALAVPPAWTDVWFCPDEKGHIQATGVDSKGRTQYRYHPAWTEVKAKIKFDAIIEFADALPALRETVRRDLAEKKFTRRKTAALVVSLMDLLHVRVGSDEYAKANDSYGLTTLQNGHFEYITGKRAEGRHDAMFSFKGKHGKPWRLLVEDDDLVDLIKKASRVGGSDRNKRLFMYIDSRGEAADIRSEHINEYIREATGRDFTAKDFRTWAACWKTAARLDWVSEAEPKDLRPMADIISDAYADAPEDEVPYVYFRNSILKNTRGIGKLAEAGKLPGTTKAERQKTQLAVIDTVAGDLGNTRDVCRSSYINPMILRDWDEGVFLKRWSEAQDKAPRKGYLEREAMAYNYLCLLGCG